MFRQSAKSLSRVAVLGATGGIGQPLSLLMKLNPMVSSLSLYDIVGSPGVAADISHVSTPAKVKGYLRDDIEKALDGAEVVIIPAGVPRKPGMTRDDLFNTNASIVKFLAEACAKHCPKACLLIISNPVNSTVPIAANALRAAGVYDPRKLFGVTTLDIVRAKTFVAEKKGMNPFDLNIPVVGGHSGPTIVPLISQANIKFDQADLDALTHRIQFGGDEVVKAKDGAGSATLSMAYAGAEFAFSLLKAMRGDKGITECTYVETTPEIAETKYFSSKVELGKEGVAKIHPIGEVSDFERGLLQKCVEELKKNIAKGENFGKN